MKTRNLIFIIVGALLLGAVFIIIWQNQSRFNWYETYEIESKEPYGAFVIGDLLKAYYPGKKFTVLNKPLNEFLQKNKTHAKENYIFIGNWLRYDSTDVEALLAFVSKGNDVFISVTYQPWNLLNKLFPDSCAELEEAGYYTLQDSASTLNFFHSSIKSEEDYQVTYAFRNQPFKYSWAYFDSTLFCGKNNDALALGYMNKGYMNFLKIHYGKGNFYLHATPLVFSNYSLLKKQNVDYASRVFSFLPKENIIWDEYSKMPGDVNFNSDLQLSQSPLQFILGQESLRWAWYITLLLLLFYMIFFGKRRQRIIPIIEPNTNTSLEFINTIGQLYYQQRNPKVICAHKMKLFQAFLRNRYFINTNRTDNEVFKRIAIKSQISLEHIQDIFFEYSQIDRNIEVTNKKLIEFHQLIEKFYKNCK